MKPVLIGVVFIASLASSFFGIGNFGLGSIPSVEACGGPREEECEEPMEDPRVVYPDYPEEDIWGYEEYMEEDGLIFERDEFADEQLAAEKAVATWWRWPLTEISDETGQRIGTLYQHPRVTPTPNGPRNESVEYVCDANYDDAQSGGCVPADRDYDCSELWSWGIAVIPVIGEDWMLLDDDGGGIGCVPMHVAQVEQGIVPIEGCSSTLTGLLPTPEEMELEWTLSSGTVTGSGCRTLAEVAGTFENPQQAAADLAEFGWKENVYQAVTYGGDIRISIHRFATPEGAQNALEYLSSVEGEPPGTVAVDQTQLASNQRALVQPQKGWAALLAQDGAFVMRVTALVNSHVPPQSQVQSVMAAVHARWLSYSQSSMAGPYYTLDPNTGQTVAIYPDGTVVPVEESPAPSMGPSVVGGTQDASTAQQGASRPVGQGGGETATAVQPTGQVGGAWLGESAAPITTETRSTGSLDGADPTEARTGYAVLPGDVVASTYPCDENYANAATGGCVPNLRDYDCGELHNIGIGDIPVIGTDWMRLDGYQDFDTGKWIASPDGLGCEWAGE